MILFQENKMFDFYVFLYLWVEVYHLAEGERLEFFPCEFELCHGNLF